VAGDECRRLEEDGGLTPARLVDASRPDDAPLHKEFEWDDAVAAERYRENQASSVIRHLVTVSIDHSDVPAARSFVPVLVTDDEEEQRRSTYVTTCVALSIEETRGMVLRRALSEARAYKRKYGGLAELAKVIAEIDDVIGEHDAEEDPE
jgi:hypothetical protein